jgi:hypothetical protein
VLVIAVSARRLGVADEDMVHALRNPIRIHELDGLDLVIGPSRSAQLLEIGVVVRDRTTVIVHAMAARGRFLG